MKKRYRWDNVDIVETDMRVWDTPHRADLIVSELLGSFGDNELSPECLYEAERLLRGFFSSLCCIYTSDEKSIMIPTSYTSYVAPVSSHELWKATLEENKQYISKQINAFEKPYVVNFHRVAVLR